jgi:hypothetical protein
MPYCKIMSRRIEGLVSRYSSRFNAMSPALLQNSVDRPSLPDRLAEMTLT